VGAFFGIVAADGALFGPFLLGLAIAPRYISGAEIGLIMLLETFLGPLWVFAAFRQVPHYFTLLGGAVLLCVLVFHELLGIREMRRESAQLRDEANTDVF